MTFGKITKSKETTISYLFGLLEKFYKIRWRAWAGKHLFFIVGWSTKGKTPPTPVVGPLKPPVLVNSVTLKPGQYVEEQRQVLLGEQYLESGETEIHTWNYGDVSPGPASVIVRQYEEES